MSDDGGSDFETAADEAQQSLPREFLEFLKTNKKWWLLPIVAMIGLLGVLMLVGGSAAQPFIYTLF